MSKWPMVKLGEVAEVVGGGTPKTSVPEYWGGEIPWLTPKDLSNHTDLRISAGERSITELGLKNSGAKILPEGAVLWSSRAPIGHVAVAAVPMATNQGFKSFIPNEDLNSEYLALVLRFMKKELQNYGTGATFKEVSGKRAASIEIPLPPLEEQKRIAGILEASARQINQVQTAIESLQQMRSSLIEDYCAASELTVVLDSLAEVTGGLSLSGKRAVNPIECEYLRVANIQRNRFLIDDVKTIRCTEKELDRCLVDDGDILMLERVSGSLCVRL